MQLALIIPLSGDHLPGMWPPTISGGPVQPPPVIGGGPVTPPPGVGGGPMPPLPPLPPGGGFVIVWIPGSGWNWMHFGGPGDPPLPTTTAAPDGSSTTTTTAHPGGSSTTTTTAHPGSTTTAPPK